MRAFNFLLGRFHGLKHSPVMAREISKDTLLIFAFFFANVGLVWWYREMVHEEQDAW